MVQQGQGTKHFYSCRHLLYKYILSTKNQDNFNFAGKKILKVVYLFQILFALCLFVYEAFSPLTLGQIFMFGSSFILNWEEMFIAIKYKVRSLSRLSNMLGYAQIENDSDKKKDQLQNWIYKEDSKQDRNIPGINIFCLNSIE